jgi:hypothetical protein
MIQVPQTMATKNVEARDPQIYKIIGAAIEIDCQPGHGFPEAVDLDAPVIEPSPQKPPWAQGYEAMSITKEKPV